jgi:hypothetical protein
MQAWKTKNHMLEERLTVRHQMKSQIQTLLAPSNVHDTVTCDRARPDDMKVSMYQCVHDSKIGWKAAFFKIYREQLYDDCLFDIKYASRQEIWFSAS